MNQVRAIEKEKLEVCLLTVDICVFLEGSKTFLAFLLDNESDPVIDNSNEDDEDGLLLDCVELLDLPVEVDYLIDRAMHESEAVLQHVHEDRHASILVFVF